MRPFDVRELRRILRLSRAELARFLGVSDVTVTRWESGGNSEPRGLQGVLLGAVTDALAARSAEDIGRIIRMAGADHRGALAQLIQAANEGGARRAVLQSSNPALGASPAASDVPPPGNS